MKKTYISPKISIVLLSQTAMITASITDTNVNGLDTDGTTSENEVTEGNVKINNYSVWDDDWNKLTD